MRFDLIEAQASVDWAVSSLPSLHQRLSDWVHQNVQLEIKELESSATHNLIVAMEKEALPLAFNVEVGAYINAIRSGLDILAYALAIRHDITRLKNVHFPVADSAAQFAAGRYKGREFMERLPPAERMTIESLKPYKGGHAYLWSLHQFDIERLRHNLLRVDIDSRRFVITMSGNTDLYVNMIKTGWMRPTDRETVLAFVRKNAPEFRMALTPQILLSDPKIGRMPLIAALDEFASTAHAIIKLFDGS